MANFVFCFLLVYPPESLPGTEAESTSIRKCFSLHDAQSLLSLPFQLLFHTSLVVVIRFLIHSINIYVWNLNLDLLSFSVFYLCLAYMVYMQDEIRGEGNLKSLGLLPLPFEIFIFCRSLFLLFFF